ncbi:MAG: serine/threonine protein kinase [Planctomycetales bacterium]|nr:serine/threonine protein kinase [Planctomycetales bacterium]
MSLSIPDFWKLVLESKLLTREQCQHLATSYGSSQGATADVNALAKWLVGQNVLSRYQASILLAGRAGPFAFGDYKIYDRVESGRLAGWFRAVHAGTNHPVMLKFLAGDAAQNANLWAYITGSIAATAHPNLVRYYEAVDLKSYKYLVTEDLRGQTLAECIQTSKALPADEASRVSQLVANALAHLHQQGRPHGDVRPANMWLEATGNVKLIYEPDVPAMAPNLAQPDESVLAKSDYLAPEFMQAGKTPDYLTDVYAVGCSLYELIAAKPPFAGGAIPEKMQRHATEAIQPLEAVGAPTPVGQAVAYMMAKNPAVRYQQATAVVEQLGQFVGAAKANYKPTAAPATAQNYEAWLQQKRSAPAAQPAAAQPRPAAAAVQAAAPVAVGAAPKKSGGSGSLAAQRKAKAKARQKNQLIMFGAAGGVALVMLIIGGIILSNMGGDDEPTVPNDQVAQVDPAPVPIVPTDEPVDGENGNGEATAAASGGQIVEDDGKLLWASPTQGQPIDLKYVPNGARIYLVVRPAEMLSKPEGERVLKALGPDFAAARAAWETAAGVALTDVERLTIAAYPNEGQSPKFCSVVQLRTASSQDALLSKWGNPPGVAELSGVFEKGNVAYYIPSDANNQTFVMGSLEPEIRDLATGTPLLLQRELGRLLQASDADRHVTVLFARDFFRGDGKLLFSGERKKGLDQLEWFFGTGLKAGMASLHFGEPFYFEMRAQNDVTIDPVTLAANLRTRADEIPVKMEDYLITLNPPPYWARIKARMRDMVYELLAQTRSGVDGDQATINAVLPGVAAHNLAFGGEMLLTLAPGGSSAMTGAVAAAKPIPKTLEELLNSPMTLSFGSNDMVIAMQELEGAVGDSFVGLPFPFKVTIMGTHLQLEGITKNQRINDFDMQNAKLSDILTAMVSKANPITTVKDPSETDQKLIWVVAPDPDNAANDIILITTRKSADGKYTLPEVFRPK